MESQRAGVLAGQLDDGAQLTLLVLEDAGGEAANRWIRIEARGVSGRQIRQLLERNGALVSRVLRTRFGTLALTRDLLRGQFRPVDALELRALLAAGGLAPAAAVAVAEDSDVESGSQRDRDGEVAPLKPERRTTAPSRRGPPGRAGRGRDR
jgi:hypothetical protein